ncbi:MAG TPA: autotransporter outer membrane beta-barrel domain-containing protein [Pseudolabrys sp.]|nr:autotransporter outer membrane beta-barrel domain-containing protein [Pseudolabrys sp.]
MVGQDGNATLNIGGGARVTSFDGYIGAGAGSVSVVTVSGHDANGNASSWTNTGTLYVGDSGQGSLLIQDGGRVEAASVMIGNNAGAIGSVTITGRDVNQHASTLTVANQIYVGAFSTNNTFDVLNGGLVNSGQALIGYDVGSEGTATVSGRDANGHASAWNAANNIYVGFSGTGTLNVVDGAAVATSAAGGGAAAVYIGYANGGTGTVNVSSSTGEVSRLTATDTVEVGYEGTGTMTVDKGGFVSAASNVYIGRFGTASGTLHLNGDATGRGVVETGSVIRGAGATTVLDLNGGILRANRNEANFLNGFTALTVGAGGAWFDTNGHDIGIGTNFSGGSSFDKLGLGQLTLTGDSSGFTGASTVSAGTLAVNGVLGGTMQVDTAGRLVGTGRVGVTTNNGVVAPGYGGAMGTLTIQGNYVGNGGRLEIATALGDDASPTSRLVVDGATSGTTQVTVINRGGLGAQTVNGIKIVDVTGVSDGTFVLNGNYVFQGAPAVIAGAYAYRLYKGGVSTPGDGDWYLRSSLADPGTPSAPAVSPLYQPGVPVYEAYGSNLQSLNTLPTLDQRVGKRIWGRAADGNGSGIWGRTEGTHGRFNNAAVSTSGLNKNTDTWKMQIGADGVLADSAAGRLVAGLNISYGEAHSRISSVFGNGTLKSGGIGLGATLTWYGAAGLYIDGQAQASRYSSDLNSDPLGSLRRDNGGSGEALSIEAGKRISFRERFAVTPQFQMIYSNVRFDHFVDPWGADVTADKSGSLRTRWGISLEHDGEWDGRRSRVYGIANISYEWLDAMRTLVAGVPIDHHDERLWGELGIGASIRWREGLSFYGELSGNTPFRGFGNSYILKANLGLRVQF